MALALSAFLGYKWELQVVLHMTKCPQLLEIVTEVRIHYPANEWVAPAEELWAQREDLRPQYPGSNCVCCWENWKLEECVYCLDSVRFRSLRAPPPVFNIWVVPEYCGKNVRRWEILLYLEIPTRPCPKASSWINKQIKSITDLDKVIIRCK